MMGACRLDGMQSESHVPSPEFDPLAELERQRRDAEGPRVEFREHLRLLDEMLVRLASRVSEVVMPTTEAFLEADRHRATELIRRHAAVTRDCVALEEACYLLIARESPVAGDLRRCVAVLRSVSDVQRSSSLLRHVAESLTWVHPPSMGQDTRDMVQRLGEVAADIFSRAIEAWRTHDGLAANELDDADDQADLIQKELLAELYTGTQSVEDAVSLALIARYYERVADHGVELARQVTYFLTGERIFGTDTDI
jgi:phosphate transport system protein